MTKTWNNWRLVPTPRVMSLSIFGLGLAVFSGVALYNSPLTNFGMEDKRSREEITTTASVKSEQTETAQPTLEQAAVEDVNAKSGAQGTNKPATPTPLDTARSDEVREIHTKEPVEEKTIVVVTAAPTPTPTVGQPSPTLTPDTSAFEASMSISGETYSVTANKILQSCQYFEESSGRSTVRVSGDGNVSGNVCTVVRANPSFPSFGMKVVSIYGEEKTFGDW